jgi:hypothetical protein
METDTLAKVIILSCAILAVWTSTVRAQSGDAGMNYTVRAVVTGSDERNRPLGFRLCFEDVLIKSSGDPSILDDNRVEALASNAGQLVAEFSYRDRLEGMPKHDDQGTYDRPFFLTCRFDPNKIDDVLRLLGRKPWLGSRPRLAMLLVVRGRKDDAILTSDGAFDADMREALANGASRYGMAVSLPSAKTLQSIGMTAQTASNASEGKLARIAVLSDGDVPLFGFLDWSDSLGWTATWNLDVAGQHHHWTVAGVNYDEAFRNALRGAAKVLSGNGEP